MSPARNALRIGTAGWSIPRDCADAFAAEGTGLMRYGAVLACTEINSTFYRSHRASTYARWLASVPEHFRFSVKVPKTITHACGLKPAPALLESFFEEIAQLAPRLGPILMQLPPKQAFESRIASDLFTSLRRLHTQGPVVLEPRHVSWYSDEARRLLEEFAISRVIADPAVDGAGSGDDQNDGSLLLYYRLHGSPRTYYSRYSDAFLEALADKISVQVRQREVWCIFDNTASGAAMSNALALARLLKRDESALL